MAEGLSARQTFDLAIAFEAFERLSMSMQPFLHLPSLGRNVGNGPEAQLEALQSFQEWNLRSHGTCFRRTARGVVRKEYLCTKLGRVDEKDC